jgi:hypothetical protein
MCLKSGHIDVHWGHVSLLGMFQKHAGCNKRKNKDFSTYPGFLVRLICRMGDKNGPDGCGIL